MIIKLKQQHNLAELLNGGCKLEYAPEYCHYPLGEIKPPENIHLLPILDDWDFDHLGWAPKGYEPLHLSALIGIGVEHPELFQKKVKITATGAVDDSSPVSFPTYVYLGLDEKGRRMIGTDGCGFVPFCLRNEGRYKFKLYGIFRRVKRNPRT